MDSCFSKLASVGEIYRVLKSPDSIWELEWRIPDFISLMNRGDNLYLSPTFSFAGRIWRLYNRVQLNHLHLGLCRDSTIPPMRLEVSLGIKTLKGKQDRKRSTEFTIIDTVWEDYRCSFFLEKSELSKRKLDLLPLDVLTVLYVLKSSKASEDEGDNATTQCSYCKVALDPENISSHEKKCVEKPIKCPECSDIIVLRNWYEHECQKIKPKGENATALCSYCKVALDSGDISSHEKKCMEKPIKCPECSDIIVLRNWYEHECQKIKPKGSSQIFCENKVFNDFRDFFMRKENYDVILKVKGQEFPAHKAILEARSPVFASTFRTDMKEKATGVVDIEDCDPCCFSDFICFLYCGDKDVISKENVFSLFNAADKYDAQDLRKMCLDFMKDNLSVDSFCETITLALRHSEAELLKLATDFFIENAKEITLTVKWQLFLAENVTEGNELIIKFIASK